MGNLEVFCFKMTILPGIPVKGKVEISRLCVLALGWKKC